MRDDADRAARAAAVDRVVASPDARFVAVFLELMRGNQIGIVAWQPEYGDALEALSGQAFSGDRAAWVEWYGATDLEPPTGFTSWKGRLITDIDEGFADLLRDDLPSRLRVEEIVWGGVGIDGIPPLDQPATLPAAEATWLQPDEPVFGIALNGEARAYPLRIMDCHEMANDGVGGVPLSLAYCTLCGAGIAYDARVADGEDRIFGSSGLLFRSNKLMYDRETRTLWNQCTGEPVLGVLAADGIEPPARLQLLPVVLTRRGGWLEQHPETTVLDIETRYARGYAVPGAAYGDYCSSTGTIFPIWDRYDLLEAKERIYGVRIEGIAKAYALSALTQERVVNDTLAGQPLLIVATRGETIVSGGNPRAGRVAWDSGGEMRAFDRGGHTFVEGPDPDTLLDESGGASSVTEEALIGPAGEQAARIAGHLAYWFGWFACSPLTLVYEQP